MFLHLIKSARKHISVIILVLFILNLSILCFAPRFGMSIRDIRDPINPYIFQRQQRTDGQTTAIYQSLDSNLQITYSNRLVRTLKITIDNDTSYIVNVNIDGGTSGEPQWPQGSTMDFILSDIIWRDSSGILYLRYILSAGAILVCSIYIIKAKYKK